MVSAAHSALNTMSSISVTSSNIAFKGRPVIAGPGRLASDVANGAGPSASRVRVGQRLGWLAQGAVFVTCDWLAGLVDWAEDRGLTANSLVGISLTLALCAAVWLSGRGRLDLFGGALALGGWLLARAVAVLAAEQADVVRQRAVGQGAVGREGAVRQGAVRQGAVGREGVIRQRAVGKEGNRRAGLRSEAVRSEAVKGFAWLFAVGSAAGECAIYGGIAAAGQSGGWTGAWPVAITTVVSLALADLLAAVGGAVETGGVAGTGGVIVADPETTGGATAPGAVTAPPDVGPGRAVAGYSMAWRWIGQVLGAPAGRVAVAGVALVLGGPQAALACVLAVTTVSVGVAAWRLASRPRPGGLSVWLPAFGPPPGDFAAWPAAPRGPVMTCRDDGALARWAGRLVRGNIMPLPPICAGVSAIALLAVLGLGGLPDIVALAPLMALLLAAPGSAHPHDGPADWLAPILLALGQFVYLAALGFGRQVPSPVVFALCALTATWYVGIATWSQVLATVPGSAVPGSAVPGSAVPGSARPMGGLGWESRAFVVTFVAIAGIATVGYLGLSLYLGVLICRTVMAGPSCRPVAAEASASA
jgi:hypothetical protein